MASIARDAIRRGHIAHLLARREGGQLAPCGVVFAGHGSLLKGRLSVNGETNRSGSGVTTAHALATRHLRAEGRTVSGSPSQN